MSLSSKLYEAMLADFKGEVLRDPDADFTPSIQKLAGEFVHYEHTQKDWPKDEREKSVKKDVINRVVLDLYGVNTRSLKIDITKVMLEACGKVKTPPTPSQRTALFRRICKTLSLHTEEDFADIIATYNWYKKTLSELKDEVRCDPDASLAPYTQKLLARLVERENERETNVEKEVINSLLLDLYGEDIPSLVKDITDMVETPQRLALFRCLCKALSLCGQEDFSGIMAMCEELEAASKTEDA